MGYIDNTTQSTLAVCARLCAGGANLIFFLFLSWQIRRHGRYGGERDGPGSGRIEILIQNTVAGFPPFPTLSSCIHVLVRVTLCISHKTNIYVYTM